ncbi:DUF305 domain-containing protein [Hymenobacter sp. BT683]|uniref:DUF305 domain-containing protein n=1 Tax=Hymenobacter jeongseonensis TaxID=2791027 RepID=A0ABS0ILK6_9BACT|nr:DUF305 domain-containing protein [Hymenobacter jeongseonensis]MBF9238655.1 DUF305 domain-containing protein [Hymenobacter jeongseonensis]
MKISAYFLAALCSGALLLSSCNRDQAADTTTTDTAAADTMAAGMDHSAMDHSAMGHAATDAANPSPLLVAMNDMMAKMEAVKMKGNADHDFANHMLQHHKGAVAMADLELRDGKDATMRRMAEKIKADQLKEISELQAAAERLDRAPANYKPQDPSDPFASKMKALMTSMMQNMPAPATDPDLNFNQLMTVHHQSAVDMAQAELAHGTDTRLKEMTQKMLTQQQKEIQQFKAWYAKKAPAKAVSAAYTCPMNCEGSASTKPGDCPKCGMALVKKS